MDQYRYALRQVAAPAGQPITVDVARRNSSIDGDEHDATFAELIQEATQFLEAQADVSLLPASWELTADCFPTTKWLYLPRWPLQTVTAINYRAGDQVATVDLATLSIRRDDEGPGRIAIADWDGWPDTDSTPDAVQITFSSGFAAGEIPGTWLRMVKGLVGFWFLHPELMATKAIHDLPVGLQAFLSAAATADVFDDFDEIW